MRTPAFIISALVLLAAAVGLHPAIAALQQHFEKQTIAPRRPLSALDVEGLPSFRPDYDAEVYETTAEEVGTSDWMSMAFRERDAAPDAAPVALFLTYYSDPRDQVPHTPEVCFRQGGAVVTRLTTTAVTIPGLGAGGTELEMRMLELDNAGVHQVLLYTFMCNGRFWWDRERVRWAIAMPGDRYVYFSKIEVLTRVPEGTGVEDAVRRCERLLAEVLPVLVQEHYPTREDVRG